MEDKDRMEILSILEKKKKITSSQSKKAYLASKNSGRSLEDELLNKGLISLDDINHARAIHLKMDCYENLDSFQFPEDLCKKIPYSFVKKNLIIPIQKNSSSILVATSDPLNLHALDDLRYRFDKDIYAVYAPQGVILKTINTLYEQNKEAASSLIEDASSLEEKNSSNEEGSYHDLLETDDNTPVIKLLNAIISEAILQKASDIHFEPLENNIEIRYRIDGILHQRHTPPKEYQAQMMTRIKVMAKLDIAERRLPQDGRLKLCMGEREIDFRVSTIPAIHGERIVLRILDKSSIELGLDKIGMDKNLTETFRNLISLPEGIILVTGPTGSGKTTTLYSAIHEISSSEINVMTIEDPVEYKLSNIAQIAAHPKINLTFATGLRHILRQDPDVIMLGEIRDQETAEVAIQASLTGHLVLSTLHTNDAPSAIIRLIDMGIAPYLISSSLIGVLAQRLLRKICSHCIVSYVPSKKELEELGLTRDSTSNLNFKKGEGCTHCFGSGYKGRHGIYEFMPLSHKIKRQISKDTDSNLLQKTALEEGMVSLRESGAKLVCKGITSTEEVLRVTRNTGIEI